MHSSWIGYEQVTLLDGFWQDRQSINARATLRAVYREFEATGRFRALKRGWKEGKFERPHIFWDSDVAKWIEAASYSLRHRADSEIERLCDALIEDILAGQRADGYYNSYFQNCEPDAVFTRRQDHELYCAGHLMEAAVAYYETTGKRTFLDAMCRLADYIEKRFVIDQDTAFATPGHEEIELALVKLWRCTGEKRYLDLSKHFIDRRGNPPELFFGDMLPAYAQSHLPVRQQFTAEGHAVRACYLYSAMADLALAYDDTGLLEACRALFSNISERRMYITGGIGSSYRGEAFTVDYDLPNDTAYAETCAAISLVFFASRMLCLEADSRYADVIERVLYNGFLSGVSLDGTAFFYKNPLQMTPRLNERDVTVSSRGDVPETTRLRVFETSCCPPNIARLIASLGGYICTRTDDTLFVHQYISARIGEVTLLSEFPASGRITLKGTGYRRVALRIPGWCDRFSIRMNGAEIPYVLERGYAYLECNGNIDLEAEFEMRVQAVESHPLVTQNAGAVAICRGPVVYCAEGADQAVPLSALRLCTAHLDATEEYHPAYRVYNLTVNGLARTRQNALYAPAVENETAVRVRMIPYFAFANRGADDMKVWMPKA